MLCYTLAYLDRVNVGFAKLQMIGDLGLSETAYGIGAGIFFIGYILFGLPSNLLLHRIGARRWIAGTLVVWGVLSGLTAFVTTPVEFWVLRFLLGVAEAGFYPGVILYLTQWFPNQRRARMTSLFQSAIPIAGIFGGPLSGWIIDRFHNVGQFDGWQWLFVIEALPAVLVGFVVMRLLTSDIASARWLSPEQKNLLSRNLESAHAATVVSPLAALRDGRAWQLGMVLFCLLCGLYAISFWMPTLLKESGTLTNTQIGWLSVFPNLLALPTMYFLSTSSDRRNERRWHVATAAFVAAGGLAGSVLFGSNVLLSLLCLSIASAGIVSALPLQWTLLNLGRGGAAAAAIGLVNSLGNLGGAVSPPFVGWLKDATHSLTLGIYFMAALLVVAGLLALMMPKPPSARTTHPDSQEVATVDAD
nr:MFS transporter [Sphingomonas sp. Root710]